MEKLIVLRHGEDCGNHLNKNGRIKIQAIADKLKTIVDKKKVIILSSKERRALESAEIVSKNLDGIEFSGYEIFEPDHDFPDGISKAVELILEKKDKANIVIVITHYWQTEDIPVYITKKIWNKTFHELRSTDNAEGWIMNCVEKTITHLKP